MNTLSRLAARHPLTGYFLLAFALSWAWLVLALGLLHLPATVAATVGSFVGPTVSAFAVSALADGRAGVLDLVRRYGRWRVSPRWYLLVLLCWPLLFVLAVLAGPGGAAALRAPAPSFVAEYLGVLAFILVLGGPLGEEPGWRGFALPRLQRAYRPLPATLLLGLLHGLWHLPVFLLVPGYNGAPPDRAGTLLAFGQFVVAVTAGAVLFTWVFNNTGGSLLPVMLLHASTNAAVVIPLGLFPGLPVNLEAVRFPAQLAIAAAVVLATRGRLSYRPYRRPAPVSGG